jgi:hypothetical protein
MSNASAPQDVVDAKASLDEHQNVSVSALAANTLVSNRSRFQRRARFPESVSSQGAPPTHKAESCVADAAAAIGRQHR